MAGGASQQQQGGDNSLAPLWIIVGLFVLAWVVWSFAHTQITIFLLQIKLGEAQFISLFSDHGREIAAVVRSVSPSTAPFDEIVGISAMIGDYLRYPLMAIIGLLAAVMYFGHANLRFKKTYTMQRLVDEEKYSWPQITPVADLDLVNTPISEGPWAMGLTPMQFAKKHDLLQVERILPTGGLVSQSKLVATVRKEDAYRVFTLQLGRYWSGVDNLNIYTKALFAIFAARVDRDREGATKLLLQIAASAKTGKPDFSGTEELLKKHRDNKEVAVVVGKHAFILTVMAAMLALARNDGVLASADFLWLKPIDRTLWFMLNSVGRQTPYSEVAGPFSHWIAERTIGHKLSVPMVDEAVKALESAMQDVIYVPDQDETEAVGT